MRSKLILFISLIITVVVQGAEEKPIENEEELPKTGLNLEHEIVNKEQSDQPSSGESFVAIHVDAKNVGALEVLRPTLRSLSYMASSFLPINYTLVDVISATREVVAGVRYNLLVNANDEQQSEPVVCALQIFEKPWLTTNWGQKYKKLEYSNCTNGEAVTEESVPNDDKTKYDINPVFQHRNTEMTDERLRDLEEQVISFMKPSKKKFSKNSAAAPTTTSTVAPESPDMSDSTKDTLDQLFLHGAFNDNNQAVNIQKPLEAGLQEEQPMLEVTEEVIIPKKVSKVWADQEEAEPTVVENQVKSSEGGIDLDVVDKISEEDETSPCQNETEPQKFESEVERALDEIFHTHLEVQETLDEFAQQNHDEPEKFEPIFGHLERQLDQFMNNFYQKYGIDDDSFHPGPAMSPYGPYDMPFIDVQNPSKPKITGAITYFDDGRQMVEEPNFFVNEDYEDLQQRQIPNTAEEIFDQSEIKNLLKRATTGSSCSSEQSMDAATKKVFDELAVVVQKVDTSEESDEKDKKTTRARRSTRTVQQQTIQTDNLDKTLIWKYANKGLSQLDQVDSDEYKRILLDVIFAKQLKKKSDEELSFMIKIRTGNSHCVEEIENIASCRKNLVTGSIKICIMEIRVRRDDNIQVIKSECAPETKLKRATCPGCTSETDPSEAETIHKMLDEALTLLNAQEEEADFKLLRVVSSTKQVVAGFRYVIEAEFNNKGAEDVTKCSVSIWDRPWLPNSREVDFDCDENKKYTLRPQKADRKKRAPSDKSGSCPGCATDTDAADATKIEDMLQEALLKLNAQEDNTELKLVRVVSSTKQVVAGYKYVVKAEFKNKDATDVTKCSVSIWDRPWIPDSREVTFECDENKTYTVNKQSQRKKRSPADKKEHCAGCPVETDASEATQIEGMLQEALVKLNAQEDNTELKLSRVISSTKQVVAGYKYTIEAEFSNKGASEVFKCSVSIWDRPWIPNSREVTFNCDENKRYTVRARRSASSNRHHHELHDTKVEEKNKHSFEKFKIRHNKNYANTIEHNMRYRIFKNNLFKIEQLNRHEQGTAKYGITEFADLTLSEYRQKTGLLPMTERNEMHENEIGNVAAEIPDIELPDAFDWREKGAITQVKNQGNCGSCWAFSVVGNIEGLNAIKTGNLEEFSEQELLDCDTIDKACGGGFMDQAYKALEQLGGLELESEYPYVAKKEKACSFNKTMSHVQVSGAIDLPKNETAMAQWLVENGPISIGVNANAMQFYRGGVSHPWHPLCSKKQLDHGVLIVGYGIKEYPMFKKSLPYWIIKNSWGPNWGEQGYYRLFRGDNSCGVSEMASSAVLA